MNGVLVNGKAVGEIQQMLDECRNHVLLEVVRCRRMMPVSNDDSNSSPFPTPSPLTVDEFDPPSVTDVRNRRDNQTASLPREVLRKPKKLQAKHLNTSEPDIVSSRDSCSHLDRIKENKPNFLDKAVNAITRPFLRSKQRAATRDAHSKTAFVYVGNSNTTVDNLAVVGSGQNASTAGESHQPDSSDHKDKSQSLQRMKACDDRHGTWPKYPARVAQRPSVLPLYAVQQSSSEDDESQLLPKPMHHVEIQRSESARHYRPQISDSIVDYVPQYDSPCSGQKSSMGADMTESPLAVYTNVCTADSVTPLGPHYAKRFSEQSSETTVTVRSCLPDKHHVTVISHFPVQHGDSEMVSYGDHMRYTQRPIPHTSPFSSAGQNLTERQSLHSPGRTLQPSLARYRKF